LIQKVKRGALRIGTPLKVKINVNELLWASPFMAPWLILQNEIKPKTMDKDVVQRDKTGTWSNPEVVRDLYQFGGDILSNTPATDLFAIFGFLRQ